jgi:hypothetical protein
MGLVMVMSAGCGNRCDVFVLGDASAVGARVLVDGGECGVLAAERSSVVVVADPARGLRGMWGDAAAGDTLMGPNVTRAALKLRLPRRACDIAVAASGGRVLRGRLEPQEYNSVVVSFDRMRMDVRTSKR